MASGKRLKQYDDTVWEVDGEQRTPDQLAFIRLAMNRRSFQLIDVLTGTEIRRFAVDDKDIVTIACAADNKTLAFSTADGIVHLYDLTVKPKTP